MSNPSSYGPLLTRIREVIEQGKGARRALAVGAFGGAYAYAGRPEVSKAIDTLSAPQYTVRMGRKVNRNRINANASFTMEDTEILVDLVWNLDTSLARDVRERLETVVYDGERQVRGALTAPNNLKQTEAGENTGLPSGLLIWLDTAEVNWRWDEDATASVTITLEAQGVCLQW